MEETCLHDNGVCLKIGEVKQVSSTCTETGKVVVTALSLYQCSACEALYYREGESNIYDPIPSGKEYYNVKERW